MATKAKKEYTPEQIAQFKADTKAKVEAAFTTLEAGVEEIFKSGKFTEYLQTMGKFHSYSVNNQILIMVQHPTARYVAGYKAWQDDFKRHVKKGEKAIQILAPNPFTIKKTVTDDEGNETEEDVKIMRFKTVSVFADDQTEGKELPNLCEELEGDCADEILERILSIPNVPVVFEDFHSDAKGYFSPTENKIVVKESISALQKAKTILHETAHSILHCKGGEEEKAERDTREIQAESVAYAVCYYLGLPVDEYSFEYVASWAYGKGVKELRANLDIIAKTASTMIESYEKAKAKEVA